MDVTLVELFRHLRVRLGLVAFVASILVVLSFNLIRGDSTELSTDGSAASISPDFADSPELSGASAETSISSAGENVSGALGADQSVVVNKRKETGAAEPGLPTSSDSVPETTSSRSTIPSDQTTRTTRTATSSRPKTRAAAPSLTTTTEATTTSTAPKRTTTTTATTSTVLATTTTARATTTTTSTIRTTTTTVPTTTTIVFDGAVNVSTASKEGPFGYRVAQDFGTASDNSEASQNLSRSTLRIFEDGVELGPAHTAHVTIRAEGQGRFSYWRESLYFSASDNTDPRTNGRTYTFVRN